MAADRRRDIGEILLQLITQDHAHEGRHERLQRLFRRRGRPAAKDQHHAAAAALNSVDQVIELEVQIGMTHEQMQPKWALECCNFQFMVDFVPKMIRSSRIRVPTRIGPGVSTSILLTDLMMSGQSTTFDTIAKAAVGLAATVLATSICMVLSSDQN
jgi:hypothetical protein